MKAGDVRRLELWRILRLSLEPAPPRLRFFWRRPGAVVTGGQRYFGVCFITTPSKYSVQ